MKLVTHRRRWGRPPVNKKTVPHHGGTPTEMLRDLADFLDQLDDAGEHLVIRSPGHPLDGRTLESALNPEGDSRTMQSDVRWLADQLERGA